MATQNTQDNFGTVYILKLDTPLGNRNHQAIFYVGWAKHLEARINHHRKGSGAAFTRAAVERGIGFSVVYTAPGTKALEREIKNKKNTRRFLVSQGITL